MGTLKAIYVRATEPPKAAVLRRRYATAFTEPGSEFYAVEQSEYDPPQAELADLSRELDTDVLWLQFQSVVDAFQFYHWRSGRCVRALVFGCHGPEERTWELAEGEAEAWERAAMFDPFDLARALKRTPRDEAKELRRVWREMKPIPGRTEPLINAREVARAAAEFYRLPGWS